MRAWEMSRVRSIVARVCRTTSGPQDWTVRRLAAKPKSLKNCANVELHPPMLRLRRYAAAIAPSSSRQQLSAVVRRNCQVEHFPSLGFRRKPDRRELLGPADLV